MRRATAFLAMLGSLTVHCSVALSQAATPTNNIVFRITMIKSQCFEGTTFSLDVDNREYWSTAKHILTCAKHPPYGTVGKSASLQLLKPGAPGLEWVSENFSVIDPGSTVDIVILAATEPLLDKPLPSVNPGVLPLASPATPHRIEKRVYVYAAG